VVAVVSGRPGPEVEGLLEAPGVLTFGLYGLEPKQARPPDAPLRRKVEAVAASVEGAWVEDKEATLAVHYRQSPDREDAERILRTQLAEVAANSGLSLLLGKMVLELAPAATPGKGTVVLREALARRLAACLYAGDDVADLEAFAALDTLAEQGCRTVKVAVRSPEVPDRLVQAADLVVDGPRGLLEMLRRL
jgi:trehalose 6-phosphate phosphatase